MGEPRTRKNNQGTTEGNEDCGMCAQVTNKKPKGGGIKRHGP